MLPLNAIPYRNSNVVERLGDELLLFDTEVGTLFEVNESGRNIWMLCDGQRSIDMINKKMARKSVNRDRARRDASAFLSKLKELNLIGIRTSKRRRKVTPRSSIHMPIEPGEARSVRNSRYVAPRISEVWSERSATSGLFLVEI